MKTRNDRDVENLIREGFIPDPAHKSRLRERLFAEDRQLELDDLDLVAGGVISPESASWEDSSAPGPARRPPRIFLLDTERFSVV